MRLRPSGRSGPVATSIDAFASYQETEAWTWEHMALTRARVVVGPAGVRRPRRGRSSAPCSAASAMPAAVAADVVEMRQAIAKEKGEDARWDLKYAAGGLIDLEFIAQYLQLVHAAETAGNPRHQHRARARQGVAARAAVGRGRRRAAAGGAALSQSDADPAALPARSVRSEDRGGGAAGTALPRRPTCRTSPRSTRISPRRSRRCARASTGFSARRRSALRRRRRRASSRSRSARPCAHRRGARPDRRRCGGAARNPCSRAAGSFSSIRFLLATVCCCTNSMFSGRRCRSYSSRMSSGASRRMTRPSRSLSSTASWMPKFKPSPPSGLLTCAASPARNTRPLRKLAATR